MLCLFKWYASLHFCKTLCDFICERCFRNKVYLLYLLTRATGRFPCHQSLRITALSTLYGLYQSRTLPFGLFAGPTTFQRLIDWVLLPHAAFVAAYLDDVIIHSSTTTAGRNMCNRCTEEVCSWTEGIWGTTWAVGRCSDRSINLQLFCFSFISQRWGFEVFCNFMSIILWCFTTKDEYFYFVFVERIKVK